MNGTVLRKGALFRAGKRLWTRAEEAKLRARYPHEPTAKVARALRRTAPSVSQRARVLHLCKTAEYLASPAACRLRRGDQVGARTRFQKGHVPANKGLRRPGWSTGRMKETQFKPGVPSWHYMPIGSTRLIDGYVYRKVSDVPNVPYAVNWKPEHRLVWKAAGRRLRKGQALVFKNGDRTDIRLDNLERLTRRALMARNTVHNLPRPLAQAIHALGALKRQIRGRAQHAQKQDQRSA
jgi:hypothetical protein